MHYKLLYKNKTRFLPVFIVFTIKTVYSCTIFHYNTNYPVGWVQFSGGYVKLSWALTGVKQTYPEFTCMCIQTLIHNALYAVPSSFRSEIIMLLHTPCSSNHPLFQGIVEKGALSSITNLQIKQHGSREKGTLQSPEHHITDSMLLDIFSNILKHLVH